MVWWDVLFLCVCESISWRTRATCEHGIHWRNKVRKKNLLSILSVKFETRSRNYWNVLQYVECQRFVSTLFFSDQRLIILKVLKKWIWNYVEKFSYKDGFIYIILKICKLATLSFPMHHTSIKIIIFVLCWTKNWWHFLN